MRETFSADPTVVFLTSVLDDIAHGRIRVPRFQRPLVWTWLQRKELFESIFAGLPIGAMMIWSTSSSEVSCYDSLGPHPLPEVENAHESRYLMDGVQRVSTLYGALRATRNWESYDEEADADLRDFVVFADLDAADESDRFKRSVDIDRDQLRNDPTRYLPLNIILNMRELLRFQRELAVADERRIDMADEVTSAFRSYKLPLITLNSASLEVVTKSFERVNSRGADISELHMLNALTYSKDFDLLKIDSNLRNDLLSPIGWQKIDAEIVLRCLKANLNADIYKTNPDDVSRRLKSDPEALVRTFRSLRQTAEFFRESFGIANPALVPYRVQIVAIASALTATKYENCVQALTDWVWLSTYTELFGGSGRQSESAILDLRNFVSKNKFEWSLRQPPAVRSTAGLRSDFRAARVKALMLALAHNINDKSPPQGSELITRFGSDAFHFLALPGARRTDAGARFLVDPATANELKLRLLNGSIDNALMDRHIISDKALSLVRPDDFRPFTMQRALDVFEFEKSSILQPISQRLAIQQMRILGENDQELEKRDTSIGEL
jgi:hypothetical protein